MATQITFQSSTNLDYQKQAQLDFVSQFLHALPQESYPNGNSGLSDSHARFLFGAGGPLEDMVVNKKGGDAFTTGKVVLSPHFIPRNFTKEFLVKTKPMLTDDGFDVRFLIFTNEHINSKHSFDELNRMKKTVLREYYTWLSSK